MQIVLDSSLTQYSNGDTEWSYLLDRLNRKVGKDFTLISEAESRKCTFGFLEMLAGAYSFHEKVAINPQDLWYIVLTEIAQQIKKRPEDFRALFTDSSDKKSIVVSTSDPTTINLGLVLDQLFGLVPTNLSDFLPVLSTSTPASSTAFYAALCDGLETYYNYFTFLCGIPAIKILGVEEDWTSLVNSAEKLADVFAEHGLLDMTSYMKRVSSRLKMFVDVFNEVPDVGYWKNIFSHKNVGSGSEKIISGWVTDFYFEVCDLPKLENFSPSVSIVPYENLETKTKYLGVHGALIRTEDVDGFVGCEYAEFVFRDDSAKPVTEEDQKFTVEVTQVKSRAVTFGPIVWKGLEPTSNLEVGDFAYMSKVLERCK